MADRSSWDIRQEREFWDAIDTYAEQFDGRVAQAFREAVDKLRASIPAAELLRIVQQFDVDALLARLDLRPVAIALRDVAEAAAERAIVAELPAKIRVLMPQRFDMLNQPAVDALRLMESRAIQSLEDDLRKGIVEQLEIGLRRGLNPVQSARAIRDMLGLPANLVRATETYRSALMSPSRDALLRALRDKRSDSVILRAIEQGESIDPARVDRLVERYRANALRMNAETVSRTAVMDAVNLGSRMTWQQAIADGRLAYDSVRRFWAIARDERVCELCAPIPGMNVGGVGMDQPFTTPVGLVMLPTLHFRCRCAVYHKIIEY